MIGSLVLAPVLDALAPEDPLAPGRRIRNTAIWLALSAWLLPDFPALGTDTLPHRAAICAAFAACAVAAHFRATRRWARVGLPVAACAAAAVVAVCGHGAVWGLAFVAFSALVLGATEARTRFLRVAPLPPEPDALPPLPRTATKVLSTLAWIGISILLMKEWAGQAMVVPTTSMEPTIKASSGQVPRLWNLWSPGDHLFVDNFSYLFRDPRRWEIVVFEYPLFRDRYFLKRVVGLPGEHLEIRDGDLWIDGKIATKPPIVQQTLWRELFPRPSLVSSRRAINDLFQSTDPAWRRVEFDEMRCTPKKGPAYVAASGTGAYRDVRLAFTATSESAGASVLARVTSRGTVVTLTLNANGASSFAVGGHANAIAASFGGRARLELCVADGETWALVDGAEVARAPVPLDSAGPNSVEVGAAVAPVNFRDVYVGRDIVYDTGGGPSAYDVPKDGFFFIGDNVTDSADSRKWTVEEFRTASGDVYRAVPTIINASGSGYDVNIKSDGTSWRFLDVDAVPRVLPRAGTTVAPSVPWPFARREHLVGRAILVFWPIVPAEAGFRPRLLP